MDAKILFILVKPSKKAKYFGINIKILGGTENCVYLCRKY